LTLRLQDMVLSAHCSRNSSREQAGILALMSMPGLSAGAVRTFRRTTAGLSSFTFRQGTSQIKESKIAGLQFFEQRMPIVFLNMCQSADLLPSMTSGLVRVFLKKGAPAVVGTESPMTAVFAHTFAKRVLDDLFAGMDIGTALWNARRHFLSSNVRNPLGLAYTLYGRATVRLGRGELVTNQSAV
jgi:CHAT domain-containing protein